MCNGEVGKVSSSLLATVAFVLFVPDELQGPGTSVLAAQTVFVVQCIFNVVLRSNTCPRRAN